MATKHIKAGALAAQVAFERARRLEELRYELFGLGEEPGAANREERRWVDKQRAPVRPKPTPPPSGKPRRG